MKNKAVILGCNYYIGLSALRSLGREGIHTVAVDYSTKDTYAATSKYCKERLIAPHYKEDPRGFVDYLIAYAKMQSEPPVLIPCHDAYVEVMDDYFHELKEVYLFPQTEQGLASKLMDKEALHQLAEERGVLVPETVRVDEPDFLQQVEERIGFPCIVKPTDSPTFVAKFRRKLFKVHNHAELEEALNKAEQAGLEVIVQRIIPGFDDHMHTFDAYINQEGKVTHWATFQKYRQYPINFGASVYTGQKYVPELYEIGAPFLEDIGYKGFVEIEFKKDAKTGKFYLIEVNVRLTNFNTLLDKLGLNMAYITYAEMLGHPVPPKAITEDRNMVFWYGYEDLLAIRDYLRSGQLTLSEIIRSLFKPKAYAIWDWRDPRPAFSYAGMIWGRIWRKLVKS